MTITWEDFEQALTRVLSRIEEGVQLCTNVAATPERFVQARLRDDATALELQTSGVTTPQGESLLDAEHASLLRASGWAPDRLTSFHSQTLAVPAAWHDYQRVAHRWVEVLRDAHSVDSPDQLVVRCWQEGGSVDLPNGCRKSWPDRDPYLLTQLGVPQVDSNWAGGPVTPLAQVAAPDVGPDGEIDREPFTMLSGDRFAEVVDVLVQVESWAGPTVDDQLLAALGASWDIPHGKPAFRLQELPEVAGKIEAVLEQVDEARVPVSQCGSERRMHDAFAAQVFWITDRLGTPRASRTRGTTSAIWDLDEGGELRLELSDACWLIHTAAWRVGDDAPEHEGTDSLQDGGSSSPDVDSWGGLDDMSPDLIWTSTTWDHLQTSLTQVIADLEPAVEVWLHHRERPGYFVRCRRSATGPVTLEATGPASSEGVHQLTPADCAVMERVDWLVDPREGRYAITPDAPASRLAPAGLADACIVALREAFHIPQACELVSRCWRDVPRLHDDGVTPWTDSEYIDLTELGVRQETIFWPWGDDD